MIYILKYSEMTFFTWQDIFSGGFFMLLTSVSKHTICYSSQYALSECHHSLAFFSIFSPVDIVVYYYCYFFFLTTLKVRLKRSPPFDFFCRGVWEISLVSQNGHWQALKP